MQAQRKGFKGFVKKIDAVTDRLTEGDRILYSLSKQNTGDAMLELLIVGVIVFFIFGLLFFVFTIKSRAKGESPRVHTCQSCSCGKAHPNTGPVRDLESIIGNSTETLYNERSCPDQRPKSL